MISEQLEIIIQKAFELAKNKKHELRTWHINNLMFFKTSDLPLKKKSRFCSINAFMKGYGPDVLRLPYGRSGLISVTHDLCANDFKPFLEVPRDVFGSW